MAARAIATPCFAPDTSFTPHRHNPMAMPPSPASVTVATLAQQKARGEKITMLTAYDYTMAALLDEVGIDCLLVGDSLGNVVQGRATTLPVTLEQMIYHAEMVARAARRALVVVDLPFGPAQQGAEETVRASVRLLKETGCAAVKLEVTAAQAPLVSRLTEAGIPVMAHIGYRPQSVHQHAGQVVQRDAATLVAAAKTAAAAGAFAVLLECVAAPVAAQVTAAVKVPTIGIGSGPGCDGQVLVTPDLLGLTPGPRPRFARAFANLREEIAKAASEYRHAVIDGGFPAEQEAYK